ncbi:hypothetical protein N6L24_14545 [Cognatishimia sp. SS12]|uniref:hypothetical protein n=1 Tax=Cognatishimia sp. SS12 TaxID=2979465 RepID=UPI00232BA645|nr:hypothetical protein [Cognatishimia sp. SS12]MDC0739505.1 hypothetical protein [Cognatishimia sp. SS12]
MKIRNKLKLMSSVVKGLIIGSIAVTRASAVMAPPANEGFDQFAANWDKLRQELDNSQTQMPLRDELMDILSLSDLDADLDFAVRSSYAIALPEEIASLDSHWVDLMVSQGSSAQMGQYLALRASLDVPIPQGDGSALDSWLWKAWGGGGGGGDCDGGGSGGHD